MATATASVQAFGTYADILTIIIGGSFVLTKMAIRRSKSIVPPVTVGMAGADFLNGCLVVPFTTMILAVFYTGARDHLIATNTVTIAIAGFVGLIFVLGELWRLD